jgi:cytochrome c551/c552
VRIAFQDGAVHISAGIAFVSITNKVLWLSGGLPGGLPFAPCWESAPAAAAQSRASHLIDDLLGAQAAQAIFQRSISTPGCVFCQAFRIDRAGVSQHDFALAGKEGLLVEGGYALPFGQAGVALDSILQQQFVIVP